MGRRVKCRLGLGIPTHKLLRRDDPAQQATSDAKCSSAGWCRPALVRSGVAFLVVETLSSCTSLSPRRCFWRPTLGVVSSADDARSARAVPRTRSTRAGVRDRPRGRPRARTRRVPRDGRDAPLRFLRARLGGSRLPPRPRDHRPRLRRRGRRGGSPLMQSGFVLSVSDLALAARPRARRRKPPRVGPHLRQTHPPLRRRPSPAARALRVGALELESLHERRCPLRSNAGLEAFVVAAARRRVLAPIAADRPELLPIDPSLVTLRAVEWAWAAARSCVEPAPVPGESPRDVRRSGGRSAPHGPRLRNRRGGGGTCASPSFDSTHEGPPEVPRWVPAMVRRDGAPGTIVADASLLRAAATTSSFPPPRVRVSDFSPRAGTTKQRLFSRGDAPPVGSNPFDAATVTIDLANAAASVPGATRVAVAVADACDLRRRAVARRPTPTTPPPPRTATRPPCARAVSAVSGVEIESGSDDSDSGMGRAPPELVAAVGADGRPSAFAVAAAAVALGAESGVKKTRDVRRRLARRVAAGGVETK